MTRRACTSCRYPLPNAPGPDGKLRCPECGTIDALGSTAGTPGSCMRCGYDLSGTPARGDGVAWVCPECHYVSRIEDWDRVAQLQVPLKRNRAALLVLLILPNTLVLLPLFFVSLFYGAWLPGLAIIAVVFTAEGAFLEYREHTSVHGSFSYLRLVHNTLLLLLITATAGGGIAALAMIPAYFILRR